jgi:hypothetical protein
VEMEGGLLDKNRLSLYKKDPKTLEDDTRKGLPPHLCIALVGGCIELCHLIASWTMYEIAASLPLLNSIFLTLCFPLVTSLRTEIGSTNILKRH